MKTLEIHEERAMQRENSFNEHVRALDARVKEVCPNVSMCVRVHVHVSHSYSTPQSPTPSHPVCCCRRRRVVRPSSQPRQV
jgi:hypothetical protein